MIIIVLIVKKPNLCSKYIHFCNHFYIDNFFSVATIEELEYDIFDMVNNFIWHMNPHSKIDKQIETFGLFQPLIVRIKLGQQLSSVHSRHTTQGAEKKDFTRDILF